MKGYMDECAAVDKLKAAVNALPVVIDGVGNYRTRDGKTVAIHRIAKDFFLSARGQILLDHGKKEYQVWHISGRLIAGVPTPGDIVEKLA